MLSALGQLQVLQEQLHCVLSLRCCYRHGLQLLEALLAQWLGRPQLVKAVMLGSAAEVLARPQQAQSC